jgi:hypothetical protein
VKSILSFLFGKRNTAAVLSSFSKMIDQLEDIASKELAYAERKQADIARLLSEADEHGNEARRARRASAKIKEVIGG